MVVVPPTVLDGLLSLSAQLRGQSSTAADAFDSVIERHGVMSSDGLGDDVFTDPLPAVDPIDVGLPDFSSWLTAAPGTTPLFGTVTAPFAVTASNPFTSIGTFFGNLSAALTGAMQANQLSQINNLTAQAKINALQAQATAALQPKPAISPILIFGGIALAAILLLKGNK